MSVHATERGYTVEIRIAVRSGHSALVVARAVRNAAATVLSENNNSNTRISIAVTATI